MKKDYPELEGKEVELPLVTGVVVGCNYDIGITIVRKCDRDHYVVCLINPYIGNRFNPSYNFIEIYNTIFYSFVSKIKKGMISSKFINMIEELIPDDVGYGASEETCAWGM